MSLSLLALPSSLNVDALDEGDFDLVDCDFADDDELSMIAPRSNRYMQSDDIDTGSDDASLVRSILDIDMYDASLVRSVLDTDSDDDVIPVVGKSQVLSWIPVYDSNNVWIGDPTDYYVDTVSAFTAMMAELPILETVVRY